MLEIKHLSYQVEGESGEELGILNDVSLTVADHQFVVITGPNGGGKTTLAKAIMGLVQPTGGTIAWNGTDITGLDITQRARLGVSYGFQQPPRFKGLRVPGSAGPGRGQREADPGGGLPVSDPGGPVRRRLYRPGGGRLPVRRRGQAH